MLHSLQTLKSKALVLLFAFSILLTLLLSFLHGLVPGFLVSITDAIGGLVALVVGIVYALYYLRQLDPLRLQDPRPGAARERDRHRTLSRHPAVASGAHHTFTQAPSFGTVSRVGRSLSYFVPLTVSSWQVSLNWASLRARQRWLSPWSGGSRWRSSRPTSWWGEPGSCRRRTPRR